jgi:SAM-dependent methyltransferase
MSLPPPVTRAVLLDGFAQQMIKEAKHEADTCGVGGGDKMEDVTAAGQPAEYLESLLEILACPLDNSVPLSAVRDAAGKVVALRSRDAEYSVVHNVPCLIPELREGARGDLLLWQAHQSKMWREYQDGDEGVFTYDNNEIGRQVGEIIAQAGGGLYLDVGCGARPWPVYMAASSECVQWIGIDPFLGDTARCFPFVQGMGEYLPLRRERFDGALYASTIYHQLDPQRSLRRVHSILKPMGKLFVWYTANRSRRKYWIWRGLLTLGIKRMYDKDYQWAFTPRALRGQLERAGFVVDDSVFLCEICPDFPTCKHPNEYLAIAHRH